MVTKDDIITALENGGTLDGLTEKEWLARLVVDFEDWLLADTPSMRQLLLHALNVTHVDDMHDRLDCAVFDWGRK